MPHSIDLIAESPVTVRQVHRAFASQDYWLARLATYNGVNTLDSLVVGDDGTVSVTTTQDLRDEALSGVLKMLPANLQLVRTESWTPHGEHHVRGEVRVSAPGKLGSGVADALIAPTETGSRMTFVATMEVKIPLVGGKVEKYIGRQLAEEIPALQQFTTDWINEHREEPA